ncbi:MAG: GNVR domain-containing protein [Candidatus Omnitrophota bacterium]
MEEISVGGISPIEYLRILFRRKWIIIIPTFIGLVCGICSGMLMPKKYQSNTVILVEEGKSDNPLFNNIAISTNVGQRIATIKESMLGWNSLVKLVKRLNLDQDVKNSYEYEKLILNLRRNTHISLKGPNIIDLTHVGADPQVTQDIVKNITEIFIERNVEAQNQETSDAIKFIEEQLKVYSGKIKSAEIAELQDKLNALLVDSTDEHPLVKKIRGQIKSKQEELKKEGLEYREDVVLNKETTNPIVDDIRKALDGLQSKVKAGSQGTSERSGNLDDDIYKLMLIEKMDDVMARDIRVNEQIYNMLLQRLETAKITERLQSSKEGTRYTILDPPRLPLKPFKPNKPLIAMVGLFLGCMAGIGFVFLREFLDKSFLDVQDAKEYFGQPLLGAISRIATSETMTQETDRTRFMVLVVCAIGITAVIAAMFISNIIH